MQSHRDSRSKGFLLLFLRKQAYLPCRISKTMLPTLQRSDAKCVQFMFNTFQPERLQDAIGAERCAVGMPFVQATLDDDGKLKATIGAAGQKTIMGEQRWVDVFNAAGLPAAMESDMPFGCAATFRYALLSRAWRSPANGAGAALRPARRLLASHDSAYASRRRNPPHTRRTPSVSQ